MSGEPDFGALKERSIKFWSAGNYPAIAAKIESVAQELADGCAIGAGQEILDVAAGTGNLALAAAREGAFVVASDFTPHLIELGRERIAAEGYQVDWVEADAEALPFDDASFDCAASNFGVIFAPRPQLAVSELFRVIRPGGTVGLTSWVPESFQGRIFAHQAERMPPPDGVASVVDWGHSQIVRDRIEAHSSSLQIERKTVEFSWPSLEAARDWLERNTGNMAAARASLDAEQYEAVVGEIMAILEEVNSATDGSVSFDAPYLLVVARKRG